MLAHAQTDIGKVREINEDNYICSPPLFAVADGMGGHVAGEIASQIATTTLLTHFAATEQKSDPGRRLEAGILQANEEIYRMARDKSECAGMGTTVTAAYFDGDRLCWGHVGDSRLYLLRNGALTQLTEDHSLVSELVRSGSINAEEALVHPHRNILTRAVGTGETVKVDAGTLEIKPGDKYLLCTDGLTNMLRDDTIREVVDTHSPEQAAELLISQANAAGGLDNITAILIECEVG